MDVRPHQLRACQAPAPTRSSLWREAGSQVWAVAVIIAAILRASAALGSNALRPLWIVWVCDRVASCAITSNA